MLGDYQISKKYQDSTIAKSRFLRKPCDKTIVLDPTNNYSICVHPLGSHNIDPEVITISNCDDFADCQ